jgi:hypothetical protein
VLALEKWQAYYYAPEQIQVGLTFASQAAVALENARLYEDSLNRAEELDERSQRLALLNRFSSSLTVCSTPTKSFNWRRGIAQGGGCRKSICCDLRARSSHLENNGSKNEDQSPQVAARGTDLRTPARIPGSI